MANRKYWFIKLSEDFFQSKVTRFMYKSIGPESVLIYLRLILRAVSNFDGEDAQNLKINLDGLAEDLSEEIAFDLDSDVTMTRLTIDFLKRHELIEVNEDSCAVKVPDEMVGSITASGLRMRRKRESKKASLCDAIESQGDDSKRKNQSQSQNQIQREKNSPRGKYKNVFITDEDLGVLETDFPGEVNREIEKLSEYLFQHPQKEYAHHGDIVRKWIEEDREKSNANRQRENKLKNHEERDYDMSALEKELVANSMNKLLSGGGSE